MQQPPKEPPKRGTQPLGRQSTHHFSDAFVSSNAQPSVAPARGTRQLQAPPLTSLKVAVPQRLEEVRKELNYVRHLTTLFGGSIMVLRFALYLVDNPLPPAPEPAEVLAAPAPQQEPAEVFAAPEPRQDPEDPSLERESPAEAEACLEGAEEGLEPVAVEPEPEDPVPVPFRALNPTQRDLAQAIAQVLANPKLKQRAQVTLFHFDEALRGHQEASAQLEQIYACPYEEAWERLNELAIERLKGKAYAICGFYDNYKNDPVICRLFPAPNQQNKGMTGTLNGGKTGPLVQPVVPAVQPVAPQAATSAEPGGLLGKLKGLFGK